MPSKIDLVPVDAEALLAGIQRQIDTGNAGRPNPSSAVQFFPDSSLDSNYAPEKVPGEGFPEQAYLLANPDVAYAVRSGEFKSGLEHWIAMGKAEQRSFGRRETSIGKTRPASLQSLNEMQAYLAQMGAAPPSPDTFRGVIGRQAILILRRLLWWYTRSVSGWAGAATRAFRQQHATVEQLTEQLTVEQEQSRHILLSMQEAIDRNSAETEKARDRVNVLEKEILKAEARYSEQVRKLEAALAAERAGPDDALYLAFEDLFRGPREQIKRRQTVYLAFLEELQAGTSELPILDLGCGRGEWLELLRCHHWTASGRDQNSAMVEYCRACGLDVEQGDALACLRQLPDSSLGAITSFHMIEHIPFGALLSLLRESMRVLKPGGLLILETPDPKNLTVASYSFYLDPTHLKPVPSEMLRFFVEAVGFSDCRVLELQSDQAPAGQGAELPQPLKDVLYGPRDYGLVARRPA